MLTNPSGKVPSLTMLFVLISAFNALSIGAQTCCGMQNQEDSQQLRERLNGYTQSALLKQSKMISNVDSKVKAVSQAEEDSALQSFGRNAAKIAKLKSEKSGRDRKVLIESFEAMLKSERGKSKPAPPFMSKIPNLARFEYGQFLNEPSYVESATTLIEDVANDDRNIPFIIDGTPDVSNQFKDCVAIGNDVQFFCTGTLIAPNLVVTAHHCNPDSITRIFIGLNVPVPLEDPSGGHVYKVIDRRIPVSPGGSPPDDIIVLVLEKDVDAAHATPRKVADAETTKEAKYAWIAGFGNSEFDTTTGSASGFGTRRKSPVPLIPGSLKSSSVASAFGCHFGFEFATGNLDGVASCFGDSGGPVYVKADSGEWMVAGCVSRALPGPIIGSEACGLGAVNTLVAKYPDLIAP